MIAVIQCAGSKQPEVGRLVTAAGKPVMFVADPAAAPPDDGVHYARPGDKSDDERSWRQVLLDYNRNEPDNPLKLLPAWRLYRNGAYLRLLTHFGPNNVYILSAGWGLISASFLTPDYDITFSATADPYKRRDEDEPWGGDFRMLPDDTREDIVFFGSKSYLPQFARLTRSVKARRIVFYNSKDRPEIPGCDIRRYDTTTRTNWQYECADVFMSGRISGA